MINAIFRNMKYRSRELLTYFAEIRQRIERILRKFDFRKVIFGNNSQVIYLRMWRSYDTSSGLHYHVQNKDIFSFGTACSILRNCSMHILVLQRLTPSLQTTASRSVRKTESESIV